MALQQVPSFVGQQLLVQCEREVQIQIPLLLGIQRLYWTGRSRPGVCGAGYGNEHGGWIVLQLDRPIVGEPYFQTFLGDPIIYLRTWQATVRPSPL